MSTLPNSLKSQLLELYVPFLSFFENRLHFRDIQHRHFLFIAHLLISICPTPVASRVNNGTRSQDTYSSYWRKVPGAPCTGSRDRTAHEWPTSHCQASAYVEWHAPLCVVACVTDSGIQERGLLGSAALELRDRCHARTSGWDGTAKEEGTARQDRIWSRLCE
jgi:hypothetical protein